MIRWLQRKVFRRRNRRKIEQARLLLERQDRSSMLGTILLNRRMYLPKGSYVRDQYGNTFLVVGEADGYQHSVEVVDIDLRSPAQPLPYQVDIVGSNFLILRGEPYSLRDKRLFKWRRPVVNWSEWAFRFVSVLFHSGRRSGTKKR